MGKSYDLARKIPIMGISKGCKKGMIKNKPWLAHRHSIAMYLYLGIVRTK